jgi:hypothetical protein
MDNSKEILKALRAQDERERLKADEPRRLKLQAEHEELKAQIKSGLGSIDDDRRISARMLAIRQELAPRRRPGRPRKHPIGAKRNFSRGTPQQQAAARQLRRRRTLAQKELHEVAALFAELASRGGPQR